MHCGEVATDSGTKWEMRGIVEGTLPQVFDVQRRRAKFSGAGDPALPQCRGYLSLFTLLRAGSDCK